MRVLLVAMLVASLPGCGPSKIPTSTDELVTLRTAQENTKVVGEQVTAQGAELDAWLAQVEANLDSYGPSDALPSEVMAPMQDPLFTLPSYPAVPTRTAERSQAVATTDAEFCLA